MYHLKTRIKSVDSVTRTFMVITWLYLIRLVWWGGFCTRAVSTSLKEDSSSSWWYTYVCPPPPYTLEYLSAVQQTTHQDCIKDEFINILTCWTPIGVHIPGPVGHLQTTRQVNATCWYIGFTFPRWSPLENGWYGVSLNCSGTSHGPQPVGFSWTAGKIKRGLFDVAICVAVSDAMPDPTTWTWSIDHMA